ncbi:MAG: lipase family protein [Cyclobacteriaceae bacterium]
MVYHTVDVTGDRVIASGAILIPIGITDPDVLSIQHATFFADEEAPSENGDFSVVRRKSIFAAAGNVVFLPDYIGYGETGDLVHPYFQKSSLAQSSYDFILAGREFLLSKTSIDFDKPLHLAGYSEGAYATLALANLIEAQEPDLDLGLLSLGSGAYDLEATVSEFVGSIDQPMACIACNAFFVYAYQHYHQLGGALSTYIKSPFAELIEGGLLNGDYNAAEIAAALPVSGIDLFDEAFVARYENEEEEVFQNLLEQNSISKLPNARLMIIHGNEDGVAPVFNSRDLAQNATAQGKDASYIELPGVNHFDGIIDWGFLTLQELDQLR